MLIYMMMVDSPEDRTKIEKMYYEYRSLMYHVANNILHNHFDTEDAVHHAFIKIAEHIKDIDEPLCPKTQAYVVTIAENKAIDIFRRKQRHPLEEYNEEEHGFTYDYDCHTVLGKCLSELPENYREVIILKYKFGHTFKEVARIMGITEDNAKKLALRAKAKLGAMCEEEGLLRK